MVVAIVMYNKVVFLFLMVIIAIEVGEASNGSNVMIVAARHDT